MSDTVTHVHSRGTTVEPRLKDLFQMKLVRASGFLLVSSSIKFNCSGEQGDRETGG